VLGLLDRNVSIASGEVRVMGHLVQSPTENDVAWVRGRHVGMVFQGASSSLDPLMKVGNQLREVAARHLGELPADERSARIERVISRMGFKDVGRVLKSYPHQLSGGMRQRIAIALAVVAEPEFLIADECTSALDVTTQREVVELLQSLTEGSGMGMIFVTHDLLLAGEICDRIAVMYAGQLVEIGRAAEVVAAPGHPYTRALLAAIPGRSKVLRAIEGTPPRVMADFRGCRFATRCAYVQDVCRAAETPWTELSRGGGSRCRYAEATASAAPAEAGA
jgi:oligopeptide/dipeptide ABC transporter ATP-binding protein